MARDFYIDVRCGLLHEARTKNNWIIKGHSAKGLLFEEEGHEIILYRDDFYLALKEFIANYRQELVDSVERKAAFIRKFDRLCLP